MMKPLSLLILLLLTLASQAGALKMSIWDREMQTTVGAGESSGNKFNVQLVKGYSGPVVVLFSQTDEEKKSGLYQGLQNRYDGILKNGQLTVMGRAEAAPLPAPGNSGNQGGNQGNGNGNGRPQVPPPSAATTAASSAALGATGTAVTLGKLLQPFKLNVNIQVTNQGNAPENPPRFTDSDGGGNGSGNPPAVVNTPKNGNSGNGASGNTPARP